LIDEFVKIKTKGDKKSDKFTFEDAWKIARENVIKKFINTYDARQNATPNVAPAPVIKLI
jgi:hypothetical protein